ncbi:hypothetical protein I0Q12_03405 [Rhodococcus sp. CX]|uniref:hypothetical protein n=1 Tax=Rhodococcus sp. CX TaxID=2789880 RepID=UPI0018CDD5D8|nr:hypothetical protein [Rhodococcus sp. CX]MBH0118628.1 hypothetical protein [Rhodococcus sp. CX]
MEALRAIGRERIGAFQSVMAHPDVNGLLVETDPLLRYFWDLRTTMTSSAWTDCDNYIAEIIRQFDFPGPFLELDDVDNYFERQWGWPAPRPPREHSAIPYDPTWMCNAFRAALERRGLDGADVGVLFTVLYDPSTRNFSEISATASDVGMPVRLQARPIAHAHAGPKRRHRPLMGGVSVGQAARSINGTLGGLIDMNGATYGVTCGHVIVTNAAAVQPSDPDGGTKIGNCVHSTDGTLTSPGQRCRASGHANTVDAALIELESSVSATKSVRALGQVVRTVAIADIVECERVEVSARSGTRTLEIGALALRRSMTISGTVYCFEDLLEIRRPGKRWGGKGSVSSPTKGGDSGAWVLRKEPGGYAWIGMVTAGDGPSSYAQFAESIEGWAHEATTDHGSSAVSVSESSLASGWSLHI